MGMYEGRATFFPMHEKIDSALDIDQHDSDDSELDLDKFEVNMDTGNKKKYKRVYDSKYKIEKKEGHKPGNPLARTSLGPMSFHLSAEDIQKARLQKHMAIYKRCTNTFTTVLMGLSCVAMILLYLYNFSKLQESPYFITRARVKVFEEIEF